MASEEIITLDSVRKIYARRKKEIIKRLDEFRDVWRMGSDWDIFAELAFCIFTPQSKAHVCWSAIERLRKSGLLYNGSAEDIAASITGVRFHNTKAARLVEAREKIGPKSGTSIKALIDSFDDEMSVREWFVSNIKGIGYKEASHFLRNIGHGSTLAILDRHILRNLYWLGVIPEVPGTLSPSRYLEIEEKMRKYSSEIGIPMDHLDLVFWSKQTGGVFK